MNKTIKNIIMEHCECHKCSDRDYCEFWGGCNSPYDCREDCMAAEIEEGIEAAYKRLATIPWDEAMTEIVDVYKDLEEEQ